MKKIVLTVSLLSFFSCFGFVARSSSDWRKEMCLRRNNELVAIYNVLDNEYKSGKIDLSLIKKVCNLQKSIKVSCEVNAYKRGKTYQEKCNLWLSDLNSINEATLSDIDKQHGDDLKDRLSMHCQR